jgi:3-oxoacyl-[acyl-carrier protein] reductase
MRLNGKVAIVTGAGSGFGEGIARRFAAEGAKVAVCDVNRAGAERVAGIIHQAGGTVTPIHADVAKAADWRALVRATLAEFGRIDTVVNNAGWTYRRISSVDLDEADFDRVFAINVKSIFLATKHVVPVLRQQKDGGLFIQIGSTVTKRPVPGLSAYGGTKSAVIAMTESLAVEFASEKIRFNVINPAFGETGLAANFTGGQFSDKERTRVMSTMPLGRLTTPDDIANAAVFLASAEAEFMTGAVLQVDGGRGVYG